MILYAFRKHLAEELERIPADAEQAFESYAVTTAALARRLLEYLAIDDLSVPSGFRDDPPEYPLRTVLDRILHFRVLHQDAMTFAIPGEPDLVTLYSDHTQEDGDHLYIRLREYRDVVGRLANDDAYVARHLLRRSATLLHNVMRESSEAAAPRKQLRHAEFRKWVSGMVCNAWYLLVTLIESGDVTCPEVAVECYERCRGEGPASRRTGPIPKTRPNRAAPDRPATLRGRDMPARRRPPAWRAIAIPRDTMSRASLRAGRRPGTWSSPAPHPRHSGVLPMPDPDTISADYTLRPSELAATLALLIEARQPVILWGAPGSAKSAVAQQVAADAGREYVDVRALLLDPVDLRGIAWRDSADRTRWAPPAFLPPTDDPGRWLINLQELPSAVPMVQAALYQLVLDRKVAKWL